MKKKNECSLGIQEFWKGGGRYKGMGVRFAGFKLFQFHRIFKETKSATMNIFRIFLFSF